MSTQDQPTTGAGIEDPTPDDTASVETAASDTETEQSEPDDLSLDLIFEILKNSRRREVLHYLRDLDSDERVALGKLAEHVAAIENDTTMDALTSSQRKRVYVGLYQCHLPKMDDMGVVDFNQDRGHVALAPAAEHLMEYLDRPSDEAVVDWHHYYAVVSGIGIAILGLSAIVGFTDGVLLTLLGLVVATFAFCSGVHWLVDTRTDD
ncbi:MULTISPECIES: DUF7344 domain-containing protein [Haloarcula]|uniref:DUF7344 domain-containing protein n=1 Tax=Haloarcula pellucida TaxID=1427151 RepID=A0A830GHA7_9EURY|nr:MULTISPECIES: hypothetical protein [Halomicroarcula]MDS0276753.1 hypothetical protein [Halomicroarcula sp. S1AR25-4]GGN88345.1 hypothetical protein GCM10009030_07950 [Halomicroarcula pellucida]